VAYAESQRGGGRGTEETKIKKRDMHRKRGQKPHRIALCRYVGGACSFSAFSIHPLRLRDRHRAAPIPRIQTNSSGSYRRSNKCRTFTFSSEGSATVSPPPFPSTTLRSPTTISAFFDNISFPPVLQSAFISSLAFPLANRAQ